MDTLKYRQALKSTRAYGVFTRAALGTALLSFVLGLVVWTPDDGPDDNHGMFSPFFMIWLWTIGTAASLVACAALQLLWRREFKQGALHVLLAAVLPYALAAAPLVAMFALLLLRFAVLG